MVILLLLPVALTGAALGRWTRWHPLVIALVIGSVPGLLGLLAAGGFAMEGGAILLFGGFVFIVGAWLAGLGAFVGGLRRKHVGRIG